MDHNSYLVWWLLGVPVVLAIVDRMMMGSAGAGSSRADLPRVAAAR